MYTVSINSNGVNMVQSYHNLPQNTEDKWWQQYSPGYDLIVDCFCRFVIYNKMNKATDNRNMMYTCNLFWPFYGKNKAFYDDNKSDDYRYKL